MQKIHHHGLFAYQFTIKPHRNSIEFSSKYCRANIYERRESSSSKLFTKETHQSFNSICITENYILPILYSSELETPLLWREKAKVDMRQDACTRTNTLTQIHSHTYTYSVYSTHTHSHRQICLSYGDLESQIDE